MTKVLSREDYYLLFAYYNIASNAQRQVREHTKLISEILGEGLETDGVNDAVYDPLMKSSKKEFDELLGRLLVTIEWRPAENKFAKDQRREEKVLEKTTE